MKASSLAPRDALRVLHILRAPLGGAFRHVYDLALTQAERGIEVGFVCDDSDYGAGSLQKLRALERACKLGVTRIAIPRKPSARDIATLRSMRTQWTGRPPSVLHGHGAKGSAYARVLAPSLGATAVCTPHGGALHFSYRSITGAAYLAIERALKGRTGGMIFESDFARREYLEKVGAINFPHRVIHNGLYDEEFVPVSRTDARYDFLFIGEFRELKGIFTLLDAARDLLSKHPFTLLMAGSGPDETALRDRVAQYGLEHVVTLSGPIHPARSAFAQARFVVAPSHNESMPYIVLEAIAARMPIVTTAVGGIPEIYGPMSHLLLDPNNPAALSTGMAEMLAHPDDQMLLADDLYQRARSHLSVTQMERSVFGFYESLVSPVPERSIAANADA